MPEHFSVNAINAFVPDATYQVPALGTISLQTIVAAVVIFTILRITFWVLQSIILNRLIAAAAKIPGKLDDVIIASIKNIRPWVYQVIALYFALKVFGLPGWFDHMLSTITFFIVGWQVIEIATNIINYFVVTFVERDEDGDGEVDPNSATTSHLIGLMTKFILWAMVLLFVLSNLGIEVTSLIAGLGIGGVAIAFALQGILSDLFASFSIYFDKPFRIGDFIVIGEDSGTVEKIGVKSTRIRTLQGEELVVSNAELTTARVQNFKRMKNRRVLMEFGITYETPQDLVQSIPAEVTVLFDSIDNAAFDRVHFSTFGDSALIFELVYHVESADYQEFMDAQQAVNLALLKRFAELNIDFAYPTQTIYTKKVE